MHTPGSRSRSRSQKQMLVTRLCHLQKSAFFRPANGERSAGCVEMPVEKCQTTWAGMAERWLGAPGGTLSF